MGNTFLPVSLLAKGRSCLVVGGGTVALRKIDTLLDYGVRVTVVAPEVLDKILYYADRDRLTVEKREYRSPEAASYHMVISASDNVDVNRRVSDDCEKAGVLLNVVDNPSLCNFIFPAMLTRDCLTIAVSTDGQAPFLSSHLKLVLDNIFNNHWNKIARLAAGFRKQVLQRWPEDAERRAACLERFLEADWKELIKTSSDQQIADELEKMLGT
jgi:siroheme synthase-like protein